MYFELTISGIVIEAPPGNVFHALVKLINVLFDFDSRKSDDTTRV